MSRLPCRLFLGTVAFALVLFTGSWTRASAQAGIRLAALGVVPQESDGQNNDGQNNDGQNNDKNEQVNDDRNQDVERDVNENINDEKQDLNDEKHGQDRDNVNVEEQTGPNVEERNGDNSDLDRQTDQKDDLEQEVDGPSPASVR